MHLAVFLSFVRILGFYFCGLMLLSLYATDGSFGKRGYGQCSGALNCAGGSEE